MTLPPARALLAPNRFGEDPLLQRLLSLAFIAIPLPALADPAPPLLAPGVRLIDHGIYCQTDSIGTQAAPETSLGFIDTLPGVPVMVYRQQEIPGRLGTSFGVVVELDRPILDMRIETWKPGATKAEIWYDSTLADTPQMRGFAFDYPEEIIMGLWRMEAWDGDQQLYSVEFEVLPPEALPGVTSDCNLMS
ncbi:DUF3859 domain-containing protein [Xinfangfangia sp. CPCC 101601]|uniref:DUF3859 domain-containing protein n=1 Tax=Pseudogemmobacter lacusdianii TaxID=3069608 RepID=A0ABU0VXE2_9RHOB|nr:DUF3859 domain-containing protein [Xinfangfangia sp. CPCC 101601]MDQ2066416.1 DUF3859 domain-containing protein [Xinfangfangia sp. CPCC 101601]